MTGSNHDEIQGVEDAAALLGVSAKTFNMVLLSEDVPARKSGREWKSSRRALIDWVGSGRSTEYYSGGRAIAADDLPGGLPEGGPSTTGARCARASFFCFVTQAFGFVARGGASGGSIFDQKKRAALRYFRTGALTGDTATFPAGKACEALRLG